MLILLKLLCWAIWLIIVLYLAGSGQRSFRGFNEVKIIIDDKDDLERDISCALSRLKKKRQINPGSSTGFFRFPRQPDKIEKDFKEESFPGILSGQ